MNKATFFNKTLTAHFRLKPLLVIIPMTALIACANQQQSLDNNGLDQERLTPMTLSNNPTLPDPSTTGTTKPSTTADTAGPDLTTTDSEPSTMKPDNSEPSLNPAPSLSPEQPSNPDLASNEALVSNSELISNNKPGETPMTVLVIENPETLAQLAQNHSNNIVSLPTSTFPKSAQKPSKRVFHFGFNQTQLTDEDIELIEKHAAYLKANPTLQVTIHGHTDAQGSSKYNLELSKHRAEMVVSQLKKHRINGSRIKTVGWGGGYPLLNTLHYAENRRIEIEYSEIHFAANR